MFRVCLCHTVFSVPCSLVGVCNCSTFCCTLLYVHSSIAIILIGKRELVALLSLSSWCLVMVEWLFLAVPLGCLRFVNVVFPDYTHYFCGPLLGKGRPLGSLYVMFYYVFCHFPMWCPVSGVELDCFDF